jgi:hypothetical protein
MSDRVRKSAEPDEPLAFLAESMTELVPEGTEAIVMLHDTETDRGVLHLWGFESEGEAVSAILTHLKAVFEANGQSLVVVPWHQPMN